MRIDRNDKVIKGKIKKFDLDNISLKGFPNSNIDIRNKYTGEIIQRKKIGVKGNVIKDYDYYHRGKKDKHVHDYLGNDRQDRRKPNKKEDIEMKKAEKKRRWWM